MTILGWIIFILFSVFLVSTLLAAKSLAPWVPTWSKDFDRIFTLAQLQPGERFYDLGCGNGKTVLAAAKRKGAYATGIELSFPLYIICMLRKIFQPRAHKKNIRFRFNNFFHYNFADADVIYVFGMPHSLQEKFKKQIVQKLQPGTRIISYTFAIQGMKPTTISKPEEKDLPIYLYTI